ncbi:Translation initiation factor 2B, gamma subunit (eIF-2Bgamma/GCD1) [Phaffia rhodozyma]|uniref:Translation initiation factor eIF2B subunit gamma n=1 Tax=Phaffia rhodozyma TaxID=264483 RepID=A0A0F7SZ34_PHARH|nr:Translation initiation factor 2B, gamma subunit (eIF-2Bgamma/GCD1) [Phaffia rhodozyma]
MFSAAPKRSKEFQAVVLAGHGSNLYPLTSKDTLCKALLPIGNEPMISYVLTWLEQAGILDVLILTPAPYHSSLSHHLQSFRQSQTSLGEGAMKIDLRAIESSVLDPNSGGLTGVDGGSSDESDGGEIDDEILKSKTADLLRAYSNYLSTDFILLPCDFIPPPNLPLSALLDAHRTRPNATMTSLFYERAEVGKDGPERILVGWDRQTKSLLHVQEIEDVDDEIELRMSLLWKYPRMTLTTKLLDSHVYVFKHSVLELLTMYPQIESIREELVPWLVKGGYQTRLAQAWKSALNPTPNPLRLSLQHSTSFLPPSISSPSTIPPSGRSTEESLSQSLASLQIQPSHDEDDNEEESTSEEEDGRGGRKEDKVGGGKVGCGVVVWKLEDGFVARANTLPTYFELNRQFVKNLAIQSTMLPPGALPSNSSLIDARAQISTDSLVGASTRVGERTNVKKSVVGRHCVIGRNVKILGCVIMDFVTIGDGVKLENCILSQRCTVEDKSDLRDCEVGGQFTVLAESKVKNEKLANLS